MAHTSKTRLVVASAFGGTVAAFAALHWVWRRACRGSQPLGLPQVTPLQNPLRVAILGAGVGGSSLALWLREAYKDDLDLTVFCDGPPGGRCQSIEFEGALYEAGASIISELNQHFVNFMERFGLEPRFIKELAFVPSGVFDGKSFVFRSPDPSSMRLPFLAKVVSTFRLIHRYGFLALRRLEKLAKGSGAPDFSRLYKLQSEGVAYEHPQALLDVLGPGFSNLASLSAKDWLVEEKQIPPELVGELATGGMRANYGGQSCSDLHALVGLVSIAGGIASRCFGVIGGNEQIPRRALQEAKPRLIRTCATAVRKVAGGFKVFYTPEAPKEAMKIDSEGSTGVPTAAGQEIEADEEFDVVIIAHPLERSALQMEGIAAVPGKKQLGRFRRCVAHFVKGVPRPEYFGCDASQVGALPLEILTTTSSTAPFYSIGLQYPVSASTAQEVKQLVRSALQGEPQVYKVFAPRVLSESELLQIFSPGNGGQHLRFESVGWYAYPEYEVPQKLHPFVLDPEGVFYLNAIEQAASAMEMSMISSRNAFNLVARCLSHPRATASRL